MNAVTEKDAVLPFSIFIINLERSPERRYFAVNQLKKFGYAYQVISAVDGEKLDLDKLMKDGTYSVESSEEAFSRQLTLSEIGCSLSHLDVYKEIVKKEINVALILEDDALFLDGFEEKLSVALSELPDGWGILHLNCPCPRFENLSINLIKYDGVGALPVAASAYLMSLEGARLMIEQAYPIRYPADSFVARGLRWGVKTYGVKESITAINNIFHSNIQSPRSIFGYIKRVVKFIIRPFLPTAK